MVAAMICLMYGVAGYAQPVVSTYDVQPTEKSSHWFAVPLPILVFGGLFALVIYLIYHYWANGKLTDDMS